MVIGNIFESLDNDKSFVEHIFENYNSTMSGVKKPGKIAKILKSLSHYGMNYDDKIYQNMMAIPADKQLQKLVGKDEYLLDQNLYGSWMNNNNWRVKAEEDKDFSEKTLEQKLTILRNLAIQPELEDILDVMANESIVYDDEESYICTPFLNDALVQDLNEQNLEEINHALNNNFYKIYTMLHWKQTAWDWYKRYLVDGVLAFEIVYDSLENPKIILDIIPVDPITLTKTVTEQGIVCWVQFKGVIGAERKLLDSQIIYIKYEETGVSERQSYLERLIRPFNIYRIVEQAQIIWTVTQSSFKTMFTIPIGSMNKTKGKQTLAAAMNSYREDISFNTDTGELQVNGKPNLPFNKEYWLPQNENGRPEIETIVDNGPTLNDSDQIKYFEFKLYKTSKIPASRFDKDAQSTWFGTDPTAALREEIDFSRFVTRLRNVFAQILIKPLKIQMSLSLPALKNDKRILESISLQWNSYNPFEEQMNIEVMSRRIEFISSMKDSLVTTDAEGNDIPFFSMKFLIQKYLKMSEADLELNEKFKREEQLENGGGENEGEDDSDNTEELKDELANDLGGEEGGEKGGGGEAEGGGIDDEMMGDVQPESSETTEA